MRCSEPGRRVLAGIMLISGITVGGVAFAQENQCKPRMEQDPSRNNLAHAPGYMTGDPDRPGRVTKVGTGSQPMVLVAGMGFGSDIFDSFMERHKKEYTMYAVTLAGFGGTPAPPMPPDNTSYAEQTWTNGAKLAVVNVVRENNLRNVVLIGHWQTATQAVIGVALDHPELVRAVVVISGVAKMEIPAQEGMAAPEDTPDYRKLYVDRGLAPRWFKTVTEDTWHDNNYYPHDYAQSPVRGLQLWRQAAAVPLPVSIRYLCEFWAQDVTRDLHRLSVPTLLVKPGFDAKMYRFEGRDYMKSFCIESWKGAESKSRYIKSVTIPNSRTFIMDDQPKALDRVIAEFLSKHSASN